MLDGQARQHFFGGKRGDENCAFLNRQVHLARWRYGLTSPIAGVDTLIGQCRMTSQVRRYASVRHVAIDWMTRERAGPDRQYLSPTGTSFVPSCLRISQLYSPRCLGRRGVDPALGAI